MLNSLTQLNHVAPEMVNLLQVNNEVAGYDECDYLKSAVSSWLKVAAQPQPDALLNHQDTFVLWARIEPWRCEMPYQGVITVCDENMRNSSSSICNVWDENRPLDFTEASRQYFARKLHIRVDAIEKISAVSSEDPDFKVTVIFNQNPTVALA